MSEQNTGAHKNNFLVAKFEDNENPPNTFIEALPHTWYFEDYIYWPIHAKFLKKRSDLKFIPEFANAKQWIKCKLLGVKGEIIYRIYLIKQNY